MASMEIAEWVEDDEGVAAQRARAKDLLPQITQQVKQALQEASIGVDVFLMIPATGDAIATFGTLADPPDELWTRIGEIVCSIVRRAVGLDRVCSRPLSCATTADEMTNPTGAMPSTTPASRAAGAEAR
jgi:hypothetical protein